MSHTHQPHPEYHDLTPPEPERDTHRPTAPRIPRQKPPEPKRDTQIPTASQIPRPNTTRTQTRHTQTNRIPNTTT